MKKSIPLLTLFLIMLMVFFYACDRNTIQTVKSVDFKHGKLKISDNNRFLVHEDGTPFIWLGDTAWELFHRLNREEATEYLATRARQRFTVIQAVVLAENDGLRTPNTYGQVPLIDLDPAKPNELYFEHVDFIVEKAEELGLVIGMLPTWGDKVFSEFPAAGPIVFNVENAQQYGYFLGQRYKDKPIIWILGGDRDPANAEVMDIWRAMAKGLNEGDQDAHLISYHPRGESASSTWFQNEQWLDINMYQSGHARHFNKVYAFADKDFQLLPVKPFVDGEPAYEDISVKFWDYCDWSIPKRVPDTVLDEHGLIKDAAHFKEGFFTDYDIRVHAYWDFLSGACGYTYGNNAVWQMFKKDGPIAIPCLTDWREALNRPGAGDIQHIRTLFEKRPISKTIPCQSMIVGNNPQDSTHVRAACASDQTFALVYLSVGQPVVLNLESIKGAQIRAWWYNPGNGEVMQIGVMENSKTAHFAPPTTGIGNDWLLVLDSMEEKLISLQ